MQKRHKPPVFKRIMLGMLSGFMVVQIGFAALMVPRVAHAQWYVFDPFSVISAAIDQISNAARVVDEAVGGALSTAVLGASLHLAQSLAYDSAQWIADSAWGKEPAFFASNMGDYLLDHATDGAVDALNEMSKEWIGLDLCKPKDPTFNLLIQLGFRKHHDPKVDCSFDQMSDAWDKKWEQLKDKYNGCAGNTFGSASVDEKATGRSAKKGGNLDECMTAMAKTMFKPDNTEIGLAINARLAITKKIRAKGQIALEERKEGQGFKSKKGGAAGAYISKPAPLVKEEGKASTKVKQEDRTFQMISGQLGSGYKAGLAAIPTLFLSQLLSANGENFFEWLKKPGDQKKSDPFDRLADIDGLSNPNSGDGGFGLSPQAERAFETIAIGDPSTIDIISQFTACPSEDGTVNRGPHDCVMDAKFAQAVRLADSGRAITIAEAIDRTMLQPGWRLIPPSNVGANSEVSCRNEAYCFSNIAKLRQARILPLGFEIAASESPEGRHWTLREVVDGFLSCNGDGRRDNDHPFCHLIDPNWILKAPPARCNATVPGPMLEASDTLVRKNVCADTVTCLQDDGRGACESPWGYCLKEKNIWRTGADSCAAQYSSCTTYTGSSAGAQNKVSYLSKTIDFGQCTAEDVGCRGYLTHQLLQDDGTYGWPSVLDELAGRPMHLTAKAQECTEPGCTLFTKKDGTEVHIKKAPHYLGCYDQVDPDSPARQEGDWPQKIADLALLNPAAECGQYAAVCAAEEEGCTSYAPENGDPTVPAIVAESDYCSDQCVGYDSYKQLETDFDTAEFPIHFIPSTAQQCNGAFVGCDQFVNVNSEQFEHYSFVKQCERPEEDDANSGVFYAWEGSDIQGYQLRSYVLKTSLEIPGGGQWLMEPYPIPAYAAAYDEDLMISYHDVCNQELYEARLADQDCRELFDREGRKSYRLLAHTITVSDQCHLVRKTSADIIELGNVVRRQNDCEQDAKGVWEDGACNVCKGGGENRNGTCMYWVLPSEAISCPAEAAGCRKYTGNAGGNVEEIVRHTFEDVLPEDLQAWDQGEVSAESVTVGGHSWKAVNRTNVVIQAEKDSSYTFSFWAKGEPGFVTLEFGGVIADNVGGEPTVQIVNDWQQFTLGPIYFKEVTDVLSRATVTFNMNGIRDANTFYVDNVIIKKTIAHTTLVKDSWSTPLACDNNPQDNLPGEALGCKAYRSSAGARVALKSFSNLCRAEAVGCERLVNTHNSSQSEGKTVGMECGMFIEGLVEDRIHPDSRECFADIDLDGDGSIDNQEAVCTVPVGEDTCFFEMPRAIDYDNNDKDIYRSGSSVFVVPADSLAYLVNKAEHRCSPDQIGCMALGEVTGERSEDNRRVINTVNKIVVPDQFDSIMCNASLVGCEAYNVKSLADQSNRTVYFKDPVAAGRGVCEYKKDVDATLRNGDVVTGASGWFVAGSDPLRPCEERLRKINDFQLPSQGDALYEFALAQVGVCPATANSCTEMVDPADTSQTHPDGKPYFVLDNGKLDKTSCNNKASLKEGCVLFDDRSVPNKKYQVGQTYDLSAANDNALVEPVFIGAIPPFTCRDDECVEILDTHESVSHPGFIGELVYQAPQGSYSLIDDGLFGVRTFTVLDSCNAGFAMHTTPGNTYTDNKRVIHNVEEDLSFRICIPEDLVNTDVANTIVKVSRDRACSEWLYCQSHMTVTDPSTNQKKNVCGSVGVCDSFGDVIDGIATCKNVVANPGFSGEKLTKAAYAERSVGWYDEEFTGHSLYNKYQIYDYTFVKSDVEGVGKGRTYLVSMPYDREAAALACENDGGIDDDGSNCRVNRSPGTCIAGLCVQKLGGGPIVLADAGEQALACRGYAHSQAPFTFSGKDITWVETAANGDQDDQQKVDATAIMQSLNISGFDNAAICQKGDECVCSYKKVEYGDGREQRYFDVNRQGIPKGVCGGGFTAGVNSKSKKGRACDTPVDCRDDRYGDNDSPEALRNRRDGDCLYKTNVATFNGWSGFCIDQDQSVETPGSGSEGKACQTWMPLDVVPGSNSIFNQYVEAGYQVEDPVETTRYCLEAEGNARNAGNGSSYRYANELDMSWSGYTRFSYTERDLFSRSQRKDGDLRFEEIDYIEFDWKTSDNMVVRAGKTRLVNDGQETESEAYGMLPSKPRIFAHSRQRCKEAAWMSGITTGINSNEDRYTCVTADEFAEVQPSARVRDMLDPGDALVTMFRRDGARIRGLVLMSDGQTDSDAACFQYGMQADVDCNVFVEAARNTQPDPDSGCNARLGYIGSFCDDKDSGDSGDGAWIVINFDDQHRLESEVVTTLVNRNENGGASDGFVGATAIGFDSITVARREVCKTIVDIANEEETVVQTNRLWKAQPLAGKIEGDYRVVLSPGYNARWNDSNKPFAGLQSGASLSTDTEYLRGTYDEGYDSGAASYSCARGRCGPSESNAQRHTKTTLQAGIQVMSELFGKVFNAWSLNSNKIGYDELLDGGHCGAAACYDQTNARANAKPPAIASVSDDCTEVSCGLGRVGRMTANGKDSGYIFGNGVATVQLQFYAWADTDRMPIKNVSVYWGTEEILKSGGNEGKYKNRKPYCQEEENTGITTCAGNIEETAGINITCSTPEECSDNGAGECRGSRLSFGNTPDACDTGFYQYQATYVFSEDDPACQNTFGSGSVPSGVDVERVRRLGLTPGDKYCAFKPRAIVQDNWGWCNTVDNAGAWGDLSGDADAANRCDRPSDNDNVGTPYTDWIIVAESK